jgi:hypothetical protein
MAFERLRRPWLATASDHSPGTSRPNGGWEGRRSLRRDKYNSTPVIANNGISAAATMNAS